MAGSTVRTTRYVVLKEQTAGERYALVGDTEATSSTTALRQVVSKLNADSVEGSYVAIPERSFQIVPIAVKHLEPQLLIGGGEPEKAPKAEKKPQAVAPNQAQSPKTPSSLVSNATDSENAYGQFEDMAPVAQ